MLRRIAKNCIAPVFWLCVWAGLARLVGRELLLPSPLAVLRRLTALALTADFWRTTAVSLARILCGCAAGVVLGALLAALTCRFRPLQTLLAPLLTVIKSTPVASFILLVLIWVGRDAVPAVIVVLMVVPVVWGNVSAGAENTDPLLLEMAGVYDFGPWKTFRLVYLPSVMPHFLSACQTALGLAWKAGVAAEVLTVPRHAIGRQLYESKLYLETVDLFAWTLMVILLSLLIEKLLTAALGRMRPGGERA